MRNELENVGKVADAAKEVAKATGKAIDATEKAGGFFNRVFGDIVADGFGLLSDRLKFYRAERWVSLGIETEKRLKERGVKFLRPLNPKIGLPLIEFATLEDDDDLKELWSNLLANALDPNMSEIDKSFVSVLSELTALDAIEFQRIVLEWRAADLPKLLFEDNIIQELGVKSCQSIDEDNQLSLIKLNRLGLISSTYTQFQPFNPSKSIVVDDVSGLNFGKLSTSIKAYGDLREAVKVTEFGLVFFDAVSLHE